MVRIKQRKAARLRLALKDQATVQLENGKKYIKKGKKIKEVKKNKRSKKKRKPPQRAFPTGCLGMCAVAEALRAGGGGSRWQNSR